MKQDVVRERLDALRCAGAALRRRPAHETLALLCEWLEAWRDADSPWRRELLEALPPATGFSRETVAEGLARALAPWTGDALHALVERELGGTPALDGTGPALAFGHDVTAVLLAGSIPMPTLLALLTPLVLRSPVLAKTASRDPVTAPLAVRSLRALDPMLGACAESLTIPHEDDAAIGALLEADCVVATGDDETVAAVARRVAPPRHMLGHGHRLSLAVVGEAATRGDPLRATCDALALDVALWDQQGCLSPVAVYVVGAGRQAADRLAEELAAALARAESRWPRGEVTKRAAAHIASERAQAEMRRAAGHDVVLHGSSAEPFSVVREADAEPRPAPLHRFVRVHPVADAAALLDALHPLAAHLAGIALAGFASETAALAWALAQRGASRVCTPGQLQAPPLDWRHEGRGLLLPQARLADIEV
jgi:hypothetical protein